eukprot:ANDGO_02362.mRNA.1 putative WD repeat-containing protein alr2800
MSVKPSSGTAASNTSNNSSNSHNHNNNNSSSNTDDINLEQLMELRRMFEEADKAGNGGLSIEDFTASFSTVLGCNPESPRGLAKMENFFMRIDANANGEVDWDELSTFILVGSEGVRKMRDDMTAYEFLQCSGPRTMSDNGNFAENDDGDDYDQTHSATGDAAGSKRGRKSTESKNGGNRLHASEAVLSGIAFQASDMTSPQTFDYSSLHNKHRDLVLDVFLPYIPPLQGESDFVVGDAEASGSSSTSLSPGKKGKVTGPGLSSKSPLQGSGKGGKMVDIMTIGKDSQARFWDYESLKHVSVLQLDRTTPATSALQFARSDRVAVSFLNRTIEIIDMNKREIVKRFRGTRVGSKPLKKGADVPYVVLEGLVNAPMSMAFVSDFDPTIESMLSCIPCNDDMQGSTASYWQPEHEILMLGLDSGHVQMYDIGSISNARKTIDVLSRFTVHSDWITQMLPAPHLDSLITCSMDKSIKFASVETGLVSRTLVGHTKSVKAIDWNPSKKLVVSGGLERDIFIWNPFIDHPLSVLKGHKAPVVRVFFNADDNQIISLSQDKMIKVWDIRSYRCLQTLEDNYTKYSPDDELTSMVFDHSRKRLITAGNFPKSWPMRRSVVGLPEGIAEGHVKSLVGSLYNKIFDQVVSADEETVCVWEAQTGALCFKFQSPHKICSLSFDTTGRRLLTGHAGGLVLVWNYINGQVLKECHSIGGTREVTALCCIEYGVHHSRYLSGGGAHRKVFLWQDSESPKEYLDQDHSFTDQDSDIMSMAWCPPMMLATGSDMGDIILYNFNSGLHHLRIKVSPMDADVSGFYSSPNTLPQDQEVGKSFIESLLFLKESNLLASAGGDGVVRFFDILDGHEVFSFGACKRVNQDSVASFYVTEDEKTMFVGDSVGFVLQYDISAILSDRPSVRIIESFRIQKDAVSYLGVIEKNKCIVAAACSERRVAVWTWDGRCIGYFGQHRSWKSLSKPKTFQEVSIDDSDLHSSDKNRRAAAPPTLTSTLISSSDVSSRDGRSPSPANSESSNRSFSYLPSPTASGGKGAPSSGLQNANGRKSRTLSLLRNTNKTSPSPGISEFGEDDLVGSVLSGSFHVKSRLLSSDNGLLESGSQKTEFMDTLQRIKLPLDAIGRSLAETKAHRGTDWTDRPAAKLSFHPLEEIKPLRPGKKY